MKSLSKEKVYLGDAVYAHYDGYHVVLTTENGISATNTIYLDNQVLDALAAYLHVERKKEKQQDHEDS